MKRKHLWGLSLLSGLLLSLAWPANGFAPLALIALTPLFLVEDFVLCQQIEPSTETGKNRTQYHIFGYSYACFLVWNALTTWWIWYSTPAAILAVTLNALLMACVFTLFHYSCRHLFRKNTRWFLLFVYWIGFEYFHQNWDISWPWLTLGNVFANFPQLVQWYEITGVLGGSLWILACNVLFTYWLKTWTDRKKAEKKHPVGIAIACLSLILLPMLASILRYNTYTIQGKPVEVVVVQPNIDPYTEQFNISAHASANRMLNLTEEQISAQTRFIVTPESMLQEHVWEDEINYCPSVIQIQNFLQLWPQAELVAGISTYSHVKPEDSAQTGVRRLRHIDEPFMKFYRAHNTVIVINKEYNTPISLYHKSKLTPGVELMPFTRQLRFLERLALNMGGTTGTLGTDPEPKVFGDSIKFSDVICYESVFGDYVAWNVRKGAQLLFVSTNDGWWKDTPGHRQHAAYARLRAIENRRDIARSANTGTSCFINQKGQIFQKTEYGQPDCIKQTLSANTRLTFYSRYGDIPGRCFLPLSLLLILLTFIYRLFPNAWRNSKKA